MSFGQTLYFRFGGRKAVGVGGSQQVGPQYVLTSGTDEDAPLLVVVLGLVAGRTIAGVRPYFSQTSVLARLT
jgi:hypothetical protein